MAITDAILLDEWKRCFVDDNNAIFHIADSNSNILKKGALPLRKPNNTVNVQQCVLPSNAMIMYLLGFNRRGTALQCHTRTLYNRLVTIAA